MKVLKVPLVYNHADFRLIDKKIIQNLKSYKEQDIFLRGIIPSIGFKSSIVKYDRIERTAGNTKYPFIKMVRFAITGITSFSSYPLVLILYLGLIVLLSSIVLALWVFFSYSTQATVPGWASIIIPMSLFAGFQMISLGVVGLYLSKIYMEIKARPRYIIDTYTE